MKRALIGIALASLLTGCGTAGSALMTPEDTYGKKVCKKLGRGIVNVVSAPLEPINQALNYSHKADRFPQAAAAFAGGLFSGLLWHMPARLVTGGLDVATFPLPPFRPIFKPEFIRSELDFGSSPRCRREIDAHTPGPERSAPLK